jgi:hypothetical protein
MYMHVKYAVKGHYHVLLSKYHVILIAFGFTPPVLKSMIYCTPGTQSNCNHYTSDAVHNFVGDFIKGNWAII